MALTVKRSRSGLSMIEILVALGILAIGATAVISLMAAATATHKRAINRSMAARLAESVFNSTEAVFAPPLRMADFALVNGGPTRQLAQAGSLEGFDGYLFDLFATPIEPSEAVQTGPRAYLIEIEVYWLTRGQRNSEWYRTVLLPRMDVGSRGG